MKFLLDQDVYAVTARFLRELGHDVLTVAEIGLHQAEDEALLLFAQQQQRILVTRDRDYGQLVFVRRLGAGVLYLRMLPATKDAVHGQLDKVIRRFKAEELAKAFLVIEPAGYRIRRPLDE